MPPTRRTPKTPPGRWPKRVLAVRVLQAKVAWLDAPLDWREGRVVWLAPEGPVVAEPGVLSRTQRSLNKIRTYPVAAAEALGDTEAWLAQRQGRLELAKRLARIHEPDLESLAREARTGNEAALSRVLALLPVEALALAPFPISPAQILAAARPAPPLGPLVQDDTLPAPVRMLAALVWASRERALRPGPWPEAVQRAFTLGRGSGMPCHPQLAVALLTDPAGIEYVHRLEAVLPEAQAAGVEPEYVTTLLREGRSAREVVETVEALAALRPVLDRLRHQPPPAPEPRRRKRGRPQPEPNAAERGEWTRRVEQSLHLYGRRGGAEVVSGAGRVVTRLLDYPVSRRRMAAFIQTVLAHGLELSPDRLRSYVDVLDRLGDQLWTPLKLSPEEAAGLSDGTWESVLGCLVNSTVRPLQRYAGELRPELVERAFQCGRPPSAEPPPGGDAGLELVLDLQDLGVGLHSAGQNLRAFPDPRTGVVLLRQVVHATASMPSAERRHLLEEILDCTPWNSDQCRRMLQALPAVLDILVTHRDRPSECACYGLLACAVELVTHQPRHARSWLAWVIRWIGGYPAGWEYQHSWGLQRSAAIAAALSLGSPARFQALLQAGSRHDFGNRHDAMETGLRAIQDRPAALAILSDSFSRDPGRCERLLTRLGLTERFGVGARDLLEELEPRVEDAEHAAADPAWGDVLNRAPDLLPEVAGYVRASHVTGRDPIVPRGLQRVLSTRSRLERELKHLRRTLAAGETREGMDQRAAALEARLHDADRLDAQVTEELRETLPGLTREVQLQALEALVDACFRRRLVELAGPAGDVPLDDDLRNAALLSIDIDQNRKLLRQLIRRHLRGEGEWVKSHPANLAFLQQCAERGMDTAAWLEEHPRSYACSGVKGGRVRLHLQGEPLRILQMGNYFDTCLSFGGCNAYSTVTNACELNKRVIYATDGAGRVVGRKLIGINQAGKLVGFHTYTTTPDEKAALALRQVFLRYVRRFARRCRLELAAQGEPARLFAEGWYNDGVTPWNAAEDAPASPGGNLPGRSGVL